QAKRTFAGLTNGWLAGQCWLLTRRADGVRAECHCDEPFALRISKLADRELDWRRADAAGHTIRRRPNAQEPPVRPAWAVDGTPALSDHKRAGGRRKFTQFRTKPRSGRRIRTDACGCPQVYIRVAGELRPSQLAVTALDCLADGRGRHLVGDLDVPDLAF